MQWKVSVGVLKTYLDTQLHLLPLDPLCVLCRRKSESGENHSSKEADDSINLSENVTEVTLNIISSMSHSKIGIPFLRINFLVMKIMLSEAAIYL